MFSSFLILSHIKNRVQNASFFNFSNRTSFRWRILFFFFIFSNHKNTDSSQLYKLKEWVQLFSGSTGCDVTGAFQFASSFLQKEKHITLCAPVFRHAAQRHVMTEMWWWHKPPPPHLFLSSPDSSKKDTGEALNLSCSVTQSPLSFQTNPISAIQQTLKVFPAAQPESSTSLAPFPHFPLHARFN